MHVFHPDWQNVRPGTNCGLKSGCGKVMLRCVPSSSRSKDTKGTARATPCRAASPARAKLETNHPAGLLGTMLGADCFAIFVSD